MIVPYTRYPDIPEQQQKKKKKKRVCLYAATDVCEWAYIRSDTQFTVGQGWTRAVQRWFKVSLPSVPAVLLTLVKRSASHSESMSLRGFVEIQLWKKPCIRDWLYAHSCDAGSWIMLFQATMRAGTADKLRLPLYSFPLPAIIVWTVSEMNLLWLMLLIINPSRRVCCLFMLVANKLILNVSIKLTYLFSTTVFDLAVQYPSVGTTEGL